MSTSAALTSTRAPAAHSGETAGGDASSFVNSQRTEGMNGMFISTSHPGDLALRGAAGAGRIAVATPDGVSVDLCDDITTMIVTQRAYSATARIMTTNNRMLGELAHLKR